MKADQLYVDIEAGETYFIDDEAFANWKQSVSAIKGFSFNEHTVRAG